MFAKVLVANRGEIALRICRTLRELGVSSVAVYSDADRAALHVAYADEAQALGGLTAADSYLVVDKLLAAAERSGAEAVHPGYGFLAENAGFARAVEAAGLTWIGPPPAAIELMGSKTKARQAMQAAGVPIIPGTTDPVDSADEVARLGAEIGYPLLIKAAAGGGGKGMKVVRSADEAAQAFDSARREGQSYFADSAVYVERYLEDPRHVEVQVLADAHGNVIHLGERDCTIQRRHQKLVEETPSPAVTPELRERIGRIAVDAARAAGYRSAGTIEGLLSPEGDYFFMEMNTRIQVEHTVTELVTGLDLVREQVLVAAGEPLSLRQEDVTLRGHAIECRINAEDPANGFLPEPGEDHALPGAVGAGSAGRLRRRRRLGDQRPLRPDDREADRPRHRPRVCAAPHVASARRVRDRGHHVAARVPSSVAQPPVFHRRRDLPRAGRVRAARRSRPAGSPNRRPDRAAASNGALTERVAVAEVDGRRVEVKLLVAEPGYRELARRRRERAASGAFGGGSGVVASPMQGTVLDVKVAVGDEVAAGQVVCIVEAMKMENEVAAPWAGTVTDVAVEAGAPVTTGQAICVIAPA